MLRRLITLILVFAITFFGITPSASAMPANPFSEIGESLSSTGEQVGYVIKYPIDGVKRCFIEQPENGLEEITCEFLKVGAAVSVCYAIDGIASIPFPPAAALLPVCNVITLGSIGSKKFIEKGLKYIH